LNYSFFFDIFIVFPCSEIQSRKVTFLIAKEKKKKKTKKEFETRK